MLAHYYGELCVCELMEALEEDSQPKVSRNLQCLKKPKLLPTENMDNGCFIVSTLNCHYGQSL